MSKNLMEVTKLVARLRHEALLRAHYGDLILEEAADALESLSSSQPFGYWDVFNECLYKDKAMADKCAEGGNMIIPLYRHD